MQYGRFRLTVSVLLLGAVGLMLGACGSEPTSVPPPPTAIPAASIPTEPADTSTIVFGHPDDAAKLDPADVTDGESLLVTWHIYEGLTKYKRGTTEIEPALATDWEVSPDGLVWLFKLREGVTFHDGTPFDAQAVVWNLYRWYDTENPYHFPSWDFEYWADMFQGYKGEVDDDDQPKSFFVSAEAIGASTVRITLNRPNAPLLQTLAMGNFAFSSQMAVQRAGDSYGTPDGNPIAVGTGPYMLDEWTPGESIRITANPDYWGDPPETENLVFRVIPDGTTRFLALRNEEIDGMNQVNPEDIAVAQEEGHQVIFEPANNVGYLGFNQAHAPWDNLNCRLAVAHAIDKVGIVESLYADDAEPASNMMPPGLWGYNDEIEDYPYDMETAQEYMDLCLEEEGELPEEVLFYVPPIQRFYFPKPKELGEIVQASLSQLGINTKIESPDWGSVWIPAVHNGEADLFLLGWGGDNGDPDNFLCVFFCGGSADFNGDGEGNPLPADEELNEMLREAATLSDVEERRQMYEQANARIHEVVPAVPIVHRSPPLIFRDNIVGYIASPIQVLLTTVSKQ